MSLAAGVGQTVAAGPLLLALLLALAAGALSIFSPAACHSCPATCPTWPG